MVEFQVIIKITNGNDVEALAALEWLKNTYGVQIPQAMFKSETKDITSYIICASFNDAVNTIQALKNQFTDRLTTYDFQINE